MKNSTSAQETESNFQSLKVKLKKRGLNKLPVYFLLITLGALFFLPFLWMIMTSLKSNAEIIQQNFFPKTLVFENYPKSLTTMPFARYTINTLTITCLNMIGTVLTASMVAYAFAKLNWKGRDIWFVLMLSTMMLPSQVTQIPLFILYKNLGWLNTYLPLVVGSFFGGGAFNIFLLRQFFKTLPNELSEAAKIDGCTEVSIFTKIVLPLCKPALATIAIFSFMGSWNDFFGPLIYLTDPKKYTIALGLRAFQGYSGVQWNLLMAASIVTVLPTLLLFFCFQNYFVKGIALTGIKG
ncbi:carbohydrate ABC transporter permease [Lachnospiraceae bacterium OttesenSCG-928-D06]|nr:carbohydrate ABC transporter permease [Lachnospiraceae bacterium OttesenSCG-928-D06]